MHAEMYVLSVVRLCRRYLSEVNWSKFGRHGSVCPFWVHEEERCAHDVWGTVIGPRVDPCARAHLHRFPATNEAAAGSVSAE